MQPLLPERLSLIINNANASLFWSMTDCALDTGDCTNLHADITDQPALCQLIRDLALDGYQYTNNTFSCIPPYVDEPSETKFCALEQVASFDCNRNPVTCILENTGLTYDCVNASSQGYIFFDCPGVDFALVGQAIVQDQELIALNPVPYDLYQLPGFGPSNASAVVPACTQFARACGVDFTCTTPPFLGPTQSSFCQISNTTAELDMTCSGQPIQCFSATGSTGSQACFYNIYGTPVSLPPLTLLCTVSGADPSMQILYNATVQLAAAKAGGSPGTIFTANQALTASYAASCAYLLSACSATTLYCPTLVYSPVVNALVPAQSRDSFCTQTISSSCLDVTFPLPLTVNSSTLECRLTEVTNHSIVCTLGLSDTVNGCFYSCVVSDVILFMSAYGVPANVLTVPSVSQAVRCAAIRAIALTASPPSPPNIVNGLPNTFICSAPGATTFSVNSTVQDICFATSNDISQFCANTQMAPEPVQQRVFLCGTLPIYRIECLLNISYTALHDWYVCTISEFRNVTAVFPPSGLPSTNPNDPLATRLLGLDCQVRKSFVLAARALDVARMGFTPSNAPNPFANDLAYINFLGLGALINGSLPQDLTVAQLSAAVNVSHLVNGFASVCNALFQQCTIPTTCQPGVDCWCPTNAQLAAENYDCLPPGQTCEGSFCQVTNAGPIIQVNASSANVNQICLAASPLLTYHCAGGDPRVPRVYTVQCVLQQQTLIPAVLYLCQHSFNATRGSGNPYFVGNLTLHPEWQLDLLRAAPDYPAFFMSATLTATILSAGTNDQVCNLIGLNALQQTLIQCESPYISTTSAPFCSSQVVPIQASLSFTCSSLVITCQILQVATATLPGLSFCFSLPHSTVWTLQSNVDPVTYPTPMGMTGCTMGTPQTPGGFYTNAASRCGFISTFCTHTCTDSLLQTQVSGDQFCDLFQLRIKSFACNGQWIVCLPDDQNSTVFNQGAVLSSTPISRIVTSDELASTFLVNADVDRSARQMSCFQAVSATGIAISFNVSNAVETLDLQPPPGTDPGLVGSSLVLSCKVSEYVFDANLDNCITLRAQCAQNGGSIQCLAPYVATNDFPFCSIEAVAIANETRCNCGMFWTYTEEYDQYPLALEDVQCELDDPDNAFLGGDVVPETVCAAHRNAQTLGLTCARRGMLSYDTFLRIRYGPNYPTQAYAVYTVAGQYYKRYWCVDSFVNPVLTCAVRPGMFAPLCTVECPYDLVQTTLNNTIAHYCCLDPYHCQNDDDQRNCVMGRNDPTPQETPDAFNSSIYGNGTTRGNPYVVQEGLAPTTVCPPNLYNNMTVFPFPTLEVSEPNSVTVTPDALVYSQPRQMCFQGDLCQGFVAVTDQASGNTGLYFFSRPPQLATTRLEEIYVRRWIRYDTQTSYHLHRSADADVATQGTLMADGTQQGTELPYGKAKAWALERNHGFNCPDYRLNWVQYLDLELSPATVARVQRRVNQQLIDLGAPPNVIAAFQWATQNSGGRENILNSNLQNVDCDASFASSPTGRCPFRQFLVVDFEVELQRDLALGLSWSGTNVNLNFSSGNTQSILQQHKQYDVLRSTVPLFGGVDGLFHRSVLVYDDPRIATFAILGPDLPQNRAEDVVVVGWMQFPSTISTVTLATFWDLFAYYTWRDWFVYGSLIPQDFQRLTPNTQCNLSTPLWWSTEAVGCSVHRCAPSVHYTWNWRSTDPSVTWDIGLFPDPPNDAIEYDLDVIPCSGQGVCLSTNQLVGIISDELAALIAMTGQCVCDGPFNVEIGLESVVLNPETGLYEVPRSLMARGCELDMRDSCNNLEVGDNLVCSNHGRCIVQFQGFQVPQCVCGHFPPGLIPITETLGTCTLDFNQLITSQGPLIAPDCFLTAQSPLDFVQDGFQAGGICNVPEQDCDSPGAWFRSSLSTYVRGDSFSCAVPRFAENFFYSTGFCVGTPPPPVPRNVNVQWGCTCAQGWYGDLCEYVALDQGCYAHETELFLVIESTIKTVETTCIWNPHLGQCEPQYLSNMPPQFIAELLTPPTPPATSLFCRGAICSGQGTCHHVQENDLAAETLYNPLTDPTFNYLTDPIPAFETAFFNRVKARFLNQTCTCNAGYTGQFCQLRTCDPPCLAPGTCVVSPDARTNSTCQCAMDRYGRDLIGGDHCQGVVCQGRGTVVPDPQFPGLFQCQCTPPYYDAGNQTVSRNIEVSPVCASYCPGRVVTQTLGPPGNPSTSCVCVDPVSHRQLPCNNINNTFRTSFLAQLQGGFLPSPTPGNNSNTTSPSSSSSSASPSTPVSSSSSMGAPSSSVAPPPPSSSSAGTGGNVSDSSSSAGTVGLIVILTVLGALGMLVGLAWYFLSYRATQRNEEDQDSDNSRASSNAEDTDSRPT